MQEFYFYFAIIGQLMNMPPDRKSQCHLSKLMLDFNILFNCLMITLVDLQRDGVTNKRFMCMATFFITINFFLNHRSCRIFFLVLNMLDVKYINLWRWWGGGVHFLEVIIQYAYIFVNPFSEIIILSYKEFDKIQIFLSFF